MSLRALMIRVTPLLAAALFACAAAAQSDDYQEAQKLFRGGQHAQALDRVDAFLKGNPKDARARFLKGLIFTEQNKVAEAIRIFTGLTEDYPELPEPYNNLAVLYAQQGQYDKARSALELSIRTHPSYATAHENLGDIYAKMASQAYDKALQLDKANTGAQTKLGLIKELFSGSGRSTKPAAKADTAAKPAVVAAATKPAAIQPAPQVAPPPVKAAEPAPKAAVAPAVEPTAKAAAAKPAPAADASTDVLNTVNAWAQVISDTTHRTSRPLAASRAATGKRRARRASPSRRKSRSKLRCPRSASPMPTGFR
jgi:tetratricopeptide (TPR) repeat protein